MRFRTAALAALSLFAFAGAVQARKAELVDPAPVAVPSGVSAEQVAKDVKRALIGRGWQITGEQPGTIESTLHLREHVARIRVSYDAQAVRFAYVGSEKLDFAEKRGTRYIHSNYLGWIGFLVNDVSANLQVSQQGG